MMAGPGGIQFGDDARGQSTYNPIFPVLMIAGIIGIVFFGEVHAAVVSADFDATATEVGSNWLSMGHVAPEVAAILIAACGGLALTATTLGRARRWWSRTPYSLRDVGHHWGVATVDRDTYHQQEPCIICGQDERGEARYFRRDHVLFGVPVRRHRAGVNHYCDDCLEDAQRRDRVENWPPGTDEPSGIPGWRHRIMSAVSAVGAVAGIGTIVGLGLAYAPELLALVVLLLAMIGLASTVGPRRI